YGFPSVSLPLTRQKKGVLVAGSEPSRCARATGELRSPDSPAAQTLGKALLGQRDYCFLLFTPIYSYKLT
ncbi:hypothetical protein GOODEAATRI_025250, partial [Goodea atripinnis]